MASLSERVAAAKLWLISQPPNRAVGSDAPRDLAYLSTAVYALSTVSTSEVRTLRADQNWRLYINESWAIDTPIAELGCELAHVVWHLLMDHAGRALSIGVDSTTAEAWHTACDLTVHDTLKSDRAVPHSVIGRCESARSADPRLGSGRSAEDYFAMISGLPVTPRGANGGPGAEEHDCGSACDGIYRPGDLPPDADVGRLDRVEADYVREQVAIDYLDATKSRGNVPGEAHRWAKHITDPTIPWEPLLARAVRRGVAWTAGRTERTWNRPSRRQSVQPEVLQPGWRRPVPTVAMVVDTSASIDDLLLGRAMGEVDGALRGLGVAEASITVIACDAAVGAVSKVRKSSQSDLVGGGGTDMRVGLAAASALRPRPDLIAVFTDGYTPWPTAAPAGSAVIVAMLGRLHETLPETPVWATRIECRLE